MIEINPFDDLIVKEPRRPEAAVSGLNEKPVQEVLARFEKLASGPLPRKAAPLGHALLVTSDQPGFGKSHLIGRLFRALHGRATLVYVRPFQNEALAFHSLLSALVKEMSFPDRADTESWTPEEPTQFDALAHGVLGRLLADVLERQGDQPEYVARLRADPLREFSSGSPHDVWADWMRRDFENIRPALEASLARRGMELHSPEWLRVLFAYGYGYPDRTIRQACLDWFGAQSLSTEQGESIGARPAELIDAETAAEGFNNAARLRLIDLCQLASFYRPVVFCFDQTESYGHSSTLARTFGMVIATLVNEATNHLTLITSNQAPWVKTISAHFEDADHERIARPAIPLEGLTRAQGEELIRLRIEGSGGSSDAGAAAMLDAKWLETLFTTARDRVGARRFLQACKERWEELRNRPVIKAPLPELYEARRVNLLAEPKRLLFDADTLQWLVKTCAAGLPGVKIHTARTGYFTVGWDTPSRKVLFGFEPGSNWKRWEAIAREAEKRAEKSPPLKVVLFRGKEQPQIPGGNWKIAPFIQAAKQKCLHLIVLTRDDFAALSAGNDLYADALGGDIPFTADEVLAFLRMEFGAWWERIKGPVEAAFAPPVAPVDSSGKDQLVADVRRVVAAGKFLSIDEVIAKIGAGVSQDEVLKACGYHAEIRVHAHPKMTVLQWQSV